MFWNLEDKFFFYFVFLLIFSCEHLSELLLKYFYGSARLSESVFVASGIFLLKQLYMFRLTNKSLLNWGGYTVVWTPDLLAPIL